MNFLVDTNIFLEILMNQAGRKKCEAFLQGEPASNNRAHADLDDSLKRKLQNPRFRAAYNAEDKRIELVLQIIKLRPQR